MERDSTAGLPLREKGVKGQLVLPEPETPVITVIRFSGMLGPHALNYFRSPRIWMSRPLILDAGVLELIFFGVFGLKVLPKQIGIRFIRNLIGNRLALEGFFKNLQSGFFLCSFLGDPADQFSTICPPPGPSSRIWSAIFKTSRLCSMTKTVLPCSTSRFRQFSKSLMSWK